MLTMVPYRRFMNRATPAANSIFTDPFFRSFFEGNNVVSRSGFRVDIRENENAYLIEAELPGLTQDQINLTMNEDVLTISTDYQSEDKQEDSGRIYSERRSGHMERSFHLENINKDGITANYKNGILYLNLPKEMPEEKIVRRIPIQAEESKNIE